MSLRDLRAGDAGDLTTSIGLLIAAVIVLSGFLLYQAIADRYALSATIANQERLLQQATRIKTQLNGLAGATAKLAKEGDAGAKEIIDEMQKRGIRIEP
ncbi:MAG TPA: hypothetical protein VMF86_04815 [Stellaceae bacterium]|nr:hypothetical protein [Stellaceae bacterium]